MLEKNQIIITDDELLRIEKTQPEQNSQDDKRQMRPILYCLNLLMMVSIPGFVVFFLFFDSKRLYIKGYLGIVLTAWCICIMLATILNLKISLKNTFKTLIILDSLWPSFFLGSLSFVAMMYILDRGKWQMKMLQLAFCVAVVSKLLNVRLLLLFMRWNRIQVITFKIALSIMALTYLITGVYCLYTNYSFTFNILKAFDQKCRYFVVLFTLAAFEFMAQVLKTMCSFDYSDTFRDAYIIKDVNVDTVSKRYKILRQFKRNHDQRKKEEAQHHLIPVIKKNMSKT